MRMRIKPSVIAIVAAAGLGTRLGAALPKAFVELRGRSLLERSVSAMAQSGVVDAIYVVVSPEMEPLAARLLQGHDVTFIHGGAERADSVWNALQSIQLDDATVLIHDAARALTPSAMIARVAAAVEDGAQAVIPVVPVADTIKVVDNGFVESTPDRSRLRAVQTPQGFDLRTLREANRAYFAASASGDGVDFVPTDDASLMEWFDIPVFTVQGDPMAFKITTPIDLVLAQRITDEAQPAVLGAPDNPGA